jgi:hypothetical protein
MQVGQIVDLFINGFLPDDLSRDDISRMSVNTQLSKAYTALATLKENSTPDTEAETENRIYTQLILKPGNAQIVENLIKDCFDLDARKLRNDVLAQMISKLITYLSELINKSV